MKNSNDWTVRPKDQVATRSYTPDELRVGSDRPDSGRARYTRCQCCPYGYHIDVDFIDYLESARAGACLKNLQRLHNNKRTMRQNLESAVLRQDITPQCDSSHGGNLVQCIPTPEYSTSPGDRNLFDRYVMDEVNQSIDGAIEYIDRLFKPPRTYITEKKKLKGRSFSDLNEYGGGDILDVASFPKYSLERSRSVISTPVPRRRANIPSPTLSMHSFYEEYTEPRENERDNRQTRQLGNSIRNDACNQNERNISNKVNISSEILADDSSRNGTISDINDKCYYLSERSKLDKNDESHHLADSDYRLDKSKDESRVAMEFTDFTKCEDLHRPSLIVKLSPHSKTSYDSQYKVRSSSMDNNNNSARAPEKIKRGLGSSLQNELSDSTDDTCGEGEDDTSSTETEERNLAGDQLSTASARDFEYANPEVSASISNQSYEKLDMKLQIQNQTIEFQENTSDFNENSVNESMSSMPQQHDGSQSFSVALSPASSEYLVNTEADETLASILSNKNYEQTENNNTSTIPYMVSDCTSASRLARAMAAILPRDLGRRSVSRSTVTFDSATLSLLRHHIAASLEEMRKQEKLLKSLPLLQVRISVLREEKRLLKLQLMNERIQRKSRTESDATTDDERMSSRTSVMEDEDDLQTTATQDQDTRSLDRKNYFNKSKYSDSAFTPKIPNVDTDKQLPGGKGALCDHCRRKMPTKDNESRSLLDTQAKTQTQSNSPYTDGKLERKSVERNKFSTSVPDIFNRKTYFKNLRRHQYAEEKDVRCSLEELCQDADISSKIKLPLLKSFPTPGGLKKIKLSKLESASQLLSSFKLPAHENGHEYRIEELSEVPAGDDSGTSMTTEIESSDGSMDVGMKSQPPPDLVLTHGVSKSLKKEPAIEGTLSERPWSVSGHFKIHNTTSTEIEDNFDANSAHVHNKTLQDPDSNVISNLSKSTDSLEKDINGLRVLERITVSPHKPSEIHRVTCEFFPRSSNETSLYASSATINVGTPDSDDYAWEAALLSNHVDARKVTEDPALDEKCSLVEFCDKDGNQFRLKYDSITDTKDTTNSCTSLDGRTAIKSEVRTCATWIDSDFLHLVDGSSNTELLEINKLESANNGSVRYSGLLELLDKGCNTESQEFEIQTDVAKTQKTTDAAVNTYINLPKFVDASSSAECLKLADASTETENKTLVDASANTTTLFLFDVSCNTEVKVTADITSQTASLLFKEAACNTDIEKLNIVDNKRDSHDLKIFADLTTMTEYQTVKNKGTCTSDLQNDTDTKPQKSPHCCDTSGNQNVLDIGISAVINPIMRDRGSDTLSNPITCNNGTDAPINPTMCDNGTDAPINPTMCDNGTDAPINPTMCDNGTDSFIDHIMCDKGCDALFNTIMSDNGCDALIKPAIFDAECMVNLRPESINRGTEANIKSESRDIGCDVKIKPLSCDFGCDVNIKPLSNDAGCDVIVNPWLKDANCDAILKPRLRDISTSTIMVTKEASCLVNIKPESVDAACEAIEIFKAQQLSQDVEFKNCSASESACLDAAYSAATQPQNSQIYGPSLLKRETDIHSKANNSSAKSTITTDYSVRIKSTQTRNSVTANALICTENGPKNHQRSSTAKTSTTSVHSEKFAKNLGEDTNENVVNEEISISKLPVCQKNKAGGHADVSNARHRDWAPEERVIRFSQSEPCLNGEDEETGCQSLAKRSNSSIAFVDQSSEANTMSDASKEKFRRRMSLKVLSACRTCATWLKDSIQVNSKQLNSAVQAIKEEWFGLISTKEAAAERVLEFVKQLSLISNSLVRYVLNMTDKNGNTALHYAVSNGNAQLIGQLLDTSCCDVTLQNRAGCTVLMLAVLVPIATQEQCHVIKRLTEHGALDACTETTGQTALMLAAGRNHGDAIRLLLAAGCDVNARDSDGSTALMCASEHGHMDIVKMLIAHPGCDPTLADCDGSTALSVAMEAGHRNIGLLLYTHINFRKSSLDSRSTRKSIRRNKL